MKRWLWIILFLLVGAVASAREPDFNFTESITFKIKQSRESFSISSQTEIQRINLTERSLSDKEWLLASPSFAPFTHVKLRHNGKSLRRATYEHPMELGREYLNDDRVVELMLPEDLAVGDTISLSYSQDYIDIAYLHLFTVPNINATGSYELRFEHPNQMLIEPEFYFPRDSVPYRVERPSEKETIVAFDSLTYSPPLKYFAFNQALAKVLIKIKINDRLITPSTPQSFMDWYARRAPVDVELDSASRAKCAGQIRTTDDTATFADINGYIHRRIRYISDDRELHGIIPHTPDETMGREYGDCKDRAYLATSMARSYGKQVWMALISTEAQPTFTDINYGLWDHVICAYEGSDGYRFFDPTDEFDDFGDIPSYLSDRTALIMRPDNPQLVFTGLLDSVPNITFDLRGRIDSLSSVPALITLRHGMAATARVFRSEQQFLTFSRMMSRYLSGQLSQIAIRSVEWQNDTANQVILSAVADLSHFAAVSPDRIYLPRSPFVFPTPDIMERESDQYPLYFDTVLHLDFSLALAAPGAKVNQDSTNLKAVPGVFFSSMMTQAGPDSIVLNSRVARYPKTVSGENRRKFIDFCRAYFIAKKSMYTIEADKQ